MDRGDTLSRIAGSRTLRYVVLAIGALGAGFIALVLVALAALQFGPVRANLGEQLIAMLGEGDGVTVEVGSYEGVWPISLGVRDLTVRDGETVIATVENLSISWAPFDLLGGTLHITEVRTGAVELLALPEGSDTEEEDDAGGPLIPELPVAVQLDSLAMPDVRIAPGVAGPGEVQLEVNGQGSLASGTATLDLQARRLDGGNFSADAAIAFAPADNTVTLNIDLVDGAPGAPGLIAGLTGDMALETVRVKATSEGPAAAWRGSLEASTTGYGRVTAAADGDWREEGALAFDIDAEPGEALGDVPSPVTLDGILTRTGEAYTFEGLNVAAGDMTFAGRLTVEDPMGAPTVALSGDVGGLPMPDDAGGAVPETLRVDLDASADAALETIDVPSLTVSAPGQLITFEGVVGLGAEELSGTLSATVDDVAAYAEMAGVDAAGALDLEAEIVNFAFSGAADASLDATFRPTTLPDPALAPLIGEALRVTAELDAADFDATRIENLSIVPSSGAFTADARGQVSPGRADLTVNLASDNLAAFSELAGTDLAGATRATVRLTGPFDALTADADVTLSEARVSGTQVDGTAKATIDLGGMPTGPVTFEGRVAGAPADLSLRLAAENGDTLIEEIEAALLGITATGSARIASNGAVAANIDGNVSSLEPVGRFAGTPLGGTGTFTLTSRPTDGGPALKAVADLENFEAAGVTARTLDVTADVAPDGGLNATAKLKEVVAGSASIRDLTANVTGRTDKFDVALDAQGVATYEDARGDGSLAVMASYAGAQERVTVSRIEGRISGLPVRLASPVTADLSNGVAAGPLTLNVGRGSIEMQVAQTANSLEGNVGLDRFPIRFIAAVIGQPGQFAGTVSGTSSIDVTGSRGSSTTDITISPRVPGSDGDAPQINVSSRWDGTTLDATVTFDAPGAEDLRLTAQLPVRARGGMPVVADDARLEARAEGRVDLQEVWPLVPVEGHRLAGLMAVDLRASGPLDDLVMDGTASLDDALYENYESGLLLSPLNADLTARPAGGTVEVTAGDGGSGRLTGSGTLDMSDDAANRLDVTLSLSSFKVLRREELDATAGGEIKVVWPQPAGEEPSPLSVEGDVTVEQLEARIPDQLPSDVKTLDVTRVSADGTPIDAPEEEDEASGPAAIELDVAIRIPNQAFVRGRGLESEWQGNLALKGDVREPQVTGQVSVVRGTFEFFGKTFDLEGGRIDFTGGREIDPYLDVRANYEGDDFTAVINVTGPSSDPSINLSSVPSLPQEEIMSRILFGTGTGQLTALQAVELAQATASLTGLGGGGGGVLDALRSSLGVDVLSVGGEGVEVGSYVSQGVYVGVSQGLEAGSGEVSVEVELTDDISVESEVGSQGGTSVGVNWQRDY